MAQRLSREEFRRWAAGQRRRHERVAGEPIAMSPERIEHARIKSRVWAALDRAIRAANLPCEAYPDGITVEIDEDTDYEPDAIVNPFYSMVPDFLLVPFVILATAATVIASQAVITGAFSITSDA